MARAREIWAMSRDASLTDANERITGRAHLDAILRDPRITG
jgi:hypothetical protein